MDITQNGFWENVVIHREQSEPEPPRVFQPRRFPALSWASTDALFGFPNNDQLRELAGRMDKLHKNKADTVSNRSDIRAVGLAGERHVARCLGIPMDTRLKPGGSQRTNLRLGNVTIDVVTRTMPRNGAEPDIIVKTTAKPKPHLLALVVWHGWEYEPQLAGWIWEAELRSRGIVTEYVPGFRNYALPASELDTLANALSAQPPY